MTDKAERQTAQSMFLPDGTITSVAARSEQDSADAHAVNADIFAWGDYNELMNHDSGFKADNENKEGSK